MLEMFDGWVRNKCYSYYNNKYNIERFLSVFERLQSMTLDVWVTSKVYLYYNTW